MPRFPNPALSHLHPLIDNGLLHFPVYAMRGGTSTGAVLWSAHLPQQLALRDELLRHLMGVPLTGEVASNSQTGGLGRGTPTSNKIFLVDVATPVGAKPRITSTLAQLAANKSAIDWSVNCGNMSAALPLYALDTGLISTPPGADSLSMEIHNTNTGSQMRADLRLIDGRVPADVSIPGVLGHYPGVDLVLQAPAGAKTGAMLPTGHASEVIDGIEVSCVDVAVPMLIVAAADLGKRGDESPRELDADPVFKERLRALWVAAGLRMGLKNRGGQLLDAAQLAASETMPKVCIVAPARNGGHIAVRYFTPQSAHASLAVSGGCCLAAACLIPGSVAHRIARQIGYELDRNKTASVDIAIEHPAGILDTRIEIGVDGNQLRIHNAAYRRSAQVLLRGHMPLYQASPALVQSMRQLQD